MVGNNNPTAIADAAAMFRIASGDDTALSLLFGSLVAQSKEGACRDVDVEDTENCWVGATANAKPMINCKHFEYIFLRETTEVYRLDRRPHNMII